MKPSSHSRRPALSTLWQRPGSLLLSNGNGDRPPSPLERGRTRRAQDSRAQASPARASRTLPAALPLAIALAIGPLPFCSVARAQTVTKTLDAFETAGWRGADDSSAAGTVRFGQDFSAEAAAGTGSATIEAKFDGKGFQFYKAAPVTPMLVPGQSGNITLWVKGNNSHTWAVLFKDGWGRTEVKGKKLEFNLAKGLTGNWTKVSFAVPADWVMPLSLDSIMVHNWSTQGQATSATLQIAQLQVQTDISAVDPQSGELRTWRPPGPGDLPANVKAPTAPPATRLVEFQVNGTRPQNVFTGQAPVFNLAARNWKPQAAEGKVSWAVTDSAGKAVQSGEIPLRVEQTQTAQIKPSTPAYGVYDLQTTLRWADGKEEKKTQAYAVIPRPVTLTEKEKDASPYGINVLFARQMMVETFRDAGIVWFRDYGFDYSWLVRAKGTDKSYSGWPWYPKAIQRYEKSGARVLACMKTAMKPPVDGKPGTPPLAWTREMVDILTAFPSIKTYELDNEYDLHRVNWAPEETVGWKNYGNYHRKFGELVRVIGDGELTAVENGRAGIWPERLRQQVESGAFENIGVVNSHHYTGTDAPEVNVMNRNTDGGGGKEGTMTFFDRLRAAKAAGQADGKRREHWLTEFGWDTRAGHVVSSREQAAYLSRGFMLLMAAGTEKGFWYWDVDSPPANNFFDGCGLITHEGYPKPAFAAYAGLTQLLPHPQLVGTLDAGENTGGYLFKDNGKLVAALFTLKDTKGPAVNFGGGTQLFDAYANPLPGNTATLGLEPVFAVGVPADSIWARQAMVTLASRQLETVTSGDTVTMKFSVANTGTAPFQGNAALQLPTGWTTETPDQNLAVPAGQTKEFEARFRVAPNEPLREMPVRLVITSGGPLKTLPLRVQTREAIGLSVRGLQGDPGTANVSLRLANYAGAPLGGQLQLKLPASWSTPQSTITVPALQPGEERTITAPITWTLQWAPGESAVAEFRTADGRAVSQPIIPPRLAIGRAPALEMDGDLKEWPANLALPTWLLGSTDGEANARLYAAWAPDGLYVAAQVQDSKVNVTDPRTFWLGDVLEIFVDTRNKKTPRAYEAGDHQFWLVPQPAQNRVYVGQWKRAAEIPATVYDVNGVRSGSKQTANGYTLEAFIPASALKGYTPQPGGNLGLNLNLSVKGKRTEREVFWVTPKGESAGQPASWGTVTLAF